MRKEANSTAEHSYEGKKTKKGRQMSDEVNRKSQKRQENLKKYEKRQENYKKTKKIRKLGDRPPIKIMKPIESDSNTKENDVVVVYTDEACIENGG